LLVILGKSQGRHEFLENLNTTILNTLGEVLSGVDEQYDQRTPIVAFKKKKNVMQHYYQATADV
jgi:hypothetical protein